MRESLATVARTLRSPLALFIIANVPFLFIFYDVWNFNTAFYAGSYLAIGLNPYQYGNQIPGGLLIQSLGLGAYYVFSSFQSNYLLTAGVLKLLYLSLTYLTGLVLSRVAKLEGLSYHRKILYAFVLNPFLLFVNDVWVETDLIIVFLSILGYAVLYYGWDRGGDYRYLIFGALCVSLAIFSYYSIVLLVPTLVLYRTSLRQRLQTLVVFLGLAALLSIPLVVFGLTSLVSEASSLQSPAAGISVYSVYNLIATPSAAGLVALERGALIVTVASAVLVPLVLKRYGVKEPVSLLTAFAIAFLVSVNSIQGDNFVLLIGLLMLALISLKRETLTYTRIFAVQLFLLPQFVVVELFNGSNGATGLFYWSYYQFHATLNVYRVLGGEDVWHSLLILYVVSFCGTIGYLLLPRFASGPRTPVAVSPPSPRRESPRSTGGPARAAWAILLAGIILLAVGVPTTMALEPSVGKPSGSISGFNAGLFLPLEYGNVCSPLPPCAFPLSSPSTFQINAPASSVHFASSSDPIGLVRNMTDQSLAINFTATVQWETQNQSLEAMDVVDASSFYAGLGAALIVNNSSKVTPTEVSGPISTVSGATTVLSGASQLFELNGDGVLTYELSPHALVGRQLVFATQLYEHAQYQDLLWDIVGSNATYEAFLAGGVFYLAYQLSPTSSWHYEVSQTLVPLDQWFLTGLEVGPSGNLLSGFVDGQKLTEPYSLGSVSKIQVNVGKFNASSASDGLYSVSGLVTNLYSLPASYAPYQPIAYVWSSLTGNLVTFSPSNPLTIAILGTDAAAVLHVERTVIPVGPFHDLWIGKLTSFPASVTIVFGAVSIGSASSGPNLAWIVLDYAVALPSLISVWCFYPFLKKRLRRLGRVTP